MHILAGDIGGTNTRLQLLQAQAGRLTLVREARYASADFASLAVALHSFLGAETVAAACFGIAGPVRETTTGQAVRTTNLPWTIDGNALAREFGFRSVRLVNDFQAIGYGIEDLAPRELLTLQVGESVVHGPKAIIGAGTGLGQGLLVWQGAHYEAIATEGGHVDFGPTSEIEFELAKYLRAELGRVSYEDILSGPGLMRLYRFLRQRGPHVESPALAHAMAQGDGAAAITDAAMVSGDALADAVLDCFVRIYGAQAGNLALTAGATGGVYVAGGIAPRIVSWLQKGSFVAAFQDKGNMSQFVSRIPLHVVLAEDAGLRGAARLASRLTSESASEGG